ncbi:Cytochrome c-type biogenesis protein CcmF [Phocoenobacter uteri]|uniref:Cytochrome c-type biogenesis protein CcmF n=1 Tax=Phocoenobacter uteri TaxID=146806 RepID=A0A379C7Q9_9PAST|nr:heme lyase CcmF/NrfE family subunit [Phocoenobacter uteri]MDG6882179.1 cytochrome C biogenesis protein CcmF [Phocoenobacter uteri]SUB58333.1 Cytochrome c-type biogenesis protein CcmF [Phocoenobacter uteri]
MLPEVGFLLLIIASISNLFLAIIPAMGLYAQKSSFVNATPKLSYFAFLSITLSFTILAYSFAIDDFSLLYVATHSNSQLPTFYKIAASWGGHNGSMLFWFFALNLWTTVFSLSNRNNKSELVIHTLAILGFITFCFSLFLIFYSNPFEREFPIPMEGSDLNPMLQDLGLIFHPPLLYLGYVGFAVTFALVMATLITNKFNAEFIRLMKTWVRIAWGFLTLGILLGAWWAYYELGWGGWWFWDPVENASLMPWLLGIALLHTLSINHKKGIFIHWTIILSLLCFSLTLLGTFIVRSGVLTSVHSFTSTGNKGLALLLLFSTLTLISFTIYAVRIKPTNTNYPIKLSSLTGMTLIFNIIISLATFVVFIGTFYPMFYTVMNWGTISVGAPYFNLLFFPLIGLVCVLMICLFTFKNNKYKHIIILLLSLVATFVVLNSTLLYFQRVNISLVAICFICVAFYLLFTTILQFNLSKIPFVLAHCGVALAIFGATMMGYFSLEKGVKLAPQQEIIFNGMTFEYARFSNEIGQNYTSEQAHFIVYKEKQEIAKLVTEKRFYAVTDTQMSEVGLDRSYLGDIYIVMGDKLGKGEFTFKLQYKPFVVWLWIGGILMALGVCWHLFSEIFTRFRLKKE